MERETGLEPATACLEGRCSLYHRLLDTNSLYRLVDRCFLVLTLARQKFSLACFAPSGKSFHVVPQKILTRVCTYEHYSVLVHTKANLPSHTSYDPTVKNENTNVSLHFSSFHSRGSRSALL
jgi:hypothetical protein